jgi:Major tropism determinant N-terminal domain
MSNQVIRKRRSTTSGLSSLVGTLGEIWIDVTKPTVVVHDGSTAGGIPLAHEVHTHANATTLTSGFMSTDDKTKLDALSVTGGIQSILSNTTPVTPRNIMNFNTDFLVVDNSGASRTDVSISTAFRSEMIGDMVALIVALG